MASRFVWIRIPTRVRGCFRLIHIADFNSYTSFYKCIDLHGGTKIKIQFNLYSTKVNHLKKIRQLGTTVCNAFVSNRQVIFHFATVCLVRLNT